MELREEKSGETALPVTGLKGRFNGDEIGLVEKEAMATTVNAIFRTLEALALRVEVCFLEKPSLHEDHCHTLKDSSLRVSFWEVERLRLAIWEYPSAIRTHFLSFFQLGP